MENTDKDIPDIDNPSRFSWLKDRKANKEEKSWGSLDEVKENNDKLWLRVYGWVIVVIAVVFATLFVVCLIVWSLHYILPAEYRWLDKTQLEKIQSILFSGGMGAVISGVVRSQLSKT